MRQMGARGIINLLLSIFGYTWAMLPAPRPKRLRPASGFSLVELSVVVAILAVVAALGLEAAANFVNKTSSSVTRDRMVQIDQAIAQFFRIYGRLPCPAVRATAPTTTSYGQEDCRYSAGYVTAVNNSGGTDFVTGGSDTGGGILFGALPFRTLNLPMSMSLDGFGSKIDYVVTKNLTVAGGSLTLKYRFGSFTATPSLTDDGIAGIEIRTGVLEQPCSSAKCQLIANPATYEGAAYIVISHGADRRGAVSVRGTTLSNCVPTAASFGTRVDSQNCAILGEATGINTASTTPANAAVAAGGIRKNVFYDNRLNSGLNLKSYYDDIVVWRTKAQL